MEFWRLNMHPNKPLGLGDSDDCPMLVLPGSPMAAAVGFTLVGRRLNARLAGDPVLRPNSLMLPLAHAVTKGPGRLEVLAGRRIPLPDGQSGVKALTMQGSASVAALSQAESLNLLPMLPDKVKARSPVSFVPFNG